MFYSVANLTYICGSRPDYNILSDNYEYEVYKILPNMHKVINT